MTILRDHPISGTVGNTVTDGFDVISGTPTYATGGADGGQCAAITNAVTEYMQDDLTAEYTAYKVRAPSLPSGDNTIAVALVTSTASAALGILSDGTVRMYSSLSTTQDTSVITLTAATWYRIEWQVGTATQEARIYTDNGSTPLETLTGATAQATLPNRYRFGHGQAGKQAGPVDFDRIVLADDWPNLGAVTGTGAPAAAAATATGAGTVSLTGAGAATAPAGVAAGAGSVSLAGAGAAVAPAGEASGAGALTVTGAGSATAPAASASGAGSVAVTGSGAATAPAATAAGAGTVATPRDITISGRLVAPTRSGSLTRTYSGRLTP